MNGNFILQILDCQKYIINTYIKAQSLAAVLHFEVLLSVSVIVYSITRSIAAICYFKDLRRANWLAIIVAVGRWILYIAV